VIRAAAGLDPSKMTSTDDAEVSFGKLLNDERTAMRAGVVVGAVQP